MVDQIRAIDNARLLKRLGRLPAKQIQQLKSNILVVLDL
ncbi:MAG: type II toxin-antitoxin system PemK/MazF family toxin [Bacteroidota bacterium]